MSRKQSQGFTLIEIAIVLVIIGLLLGGVLKGQELITSARVRNLISVQDGIKAAFFGFQDRFRALPGDYASASATANIRGVTLGGNGDGQILDTVTANEQTIAWNHLASAGFLNGSYTMATATEAVSDANTPKNAYSIYLQLGYDNNYFDSAPVNKHNLKTGNQIPVEIIAEVDRKVDDGNAMQGGFRFTRYTPASATGLAAPAAAYAAGVCTSDAGVWFVTNSETNCGGASLF